MATLHDRVRAFTPALLFGCFLALFFGLVSMLRFNQMGDVSVDSAVADELRARIFWGASFAVLATVTLWNVAIAAATTWSYLRPLQFTVAIGVAAVLALALGLRRYGGSAAQDLLVRLEHDTKVPVAALTGSMNLAAAIAIVLIISSCVALGLASNPPTEAQLRQRMFDLRVLLFSSAAFLVSGVSEIYLLFDWPRHVSALAASPLALKIAPALSMAAGALYTFLLVTIYVPIALVHERWRTDIRNRLESADQTFDSEAWQKRAGLATSIFSNAPEIFAIVSPFITAVGLPALVK